MLAIGMGLDPHRVIETIRDCAGTSWMFENRGPHIADGDYAPLSAVDIFVKDFGIVLEEAGRQRLDPVLAARALAQFRRAAAEGWGGPTTSRWRSLRPGRRHRPARRGTGMILGAIADDFTGASDLANTLAKGGMRTVLYAGIPAERRRRRRQAGVVALKSRTDRRRRGGRAVAAPRSTGCAPRPAGSSIFKYCSTFDSTPPATSARSPRRWPTRSARRRSWSARPSPAPAAPSTRATSSSATGCCRNPAWSATR